jgi:hypothetical protein
MFRILGNPRRACDGLTRREWLVAGGLGALSLAGASSASRPTRKAKSVICLFLFAGAGIKGGAVYGRSDKIGSNVAEDPVSPRDVLATVYHLCGIESSAQIYDHLRRPVSLYDDGRPIRAILT